MMNHAAAFNKEQMDARIEERRKMGQLSPSEEIQEEPMFNGRKITELTSDEYMAYMSGHAKPKVIKTKPEG